MLKLYISTAFDNILCSFLLEVHRRMSFWSKVNGLDFWSISHIIYKSNVEWMVRQTHPHRKRHEEGAPLSPMLFILIMKPLHKMVDFVARHGLLAPLARVGFQQRVSMFADDVMLFSEPMEVALEVSATIMYLYGENSGLHVNLLKSDASL